MQHYPKADPTAVEDLIRLDDYEKWLLIDASTELIAEGELSRYDQSQQQKHAFVERRSRGPRSVRRHL